MNIVCMSCLRQLRHVLFDAAESASGVESWTIFTVFNSGFSGIFNIGLTTQSNVTLRKKNRPIKFSSDLRSSLMCPV